MRLDEATWGGASASDEALPAASQRTNAHSVAAMAVVVDSEALSGREGARSACWVAEAAPRDLLALKPCHLSPLPRPRSPARYTFESANDARRRFM